MKTRQPVVEIIDPIVVECFRRMTPADRLAQAFKLWETACVMVRGAVRQQHPDFSEEEVLRESALRLSHGGTERVRR
jgi:hypothetical protein